LERSGKPIRPIERRVGDGLLHSLGVERISLRVGVSGEGGVGEGRGEVSLPSHQWAPQHAAREDHSSLLLERTPADSEGRGARNHVTT